MTRKGCQNKTYQCEIRGGKDREIQKMKGSEVGVGLVMEIHEIEGVRAKGIPGFERLGKRRGIGGGGVWRDSYIYILGKR